ncbi:DegT/DnrJ/EryC1/StrS family aminotransferase [Calditerrivibrio nitroreducens]|uniref:DegT/DnrJ/EryC1/StrS aminotransferase n=1 Tax=Calditerrivibrio nitroreducens (strain DSM 19672 / NBRC 101217 / Yu37-1) TaxID=768670 RepID=E4TF85_CALNY|nr:DegT/DnrJ/EryC1/StrS family aminotransferase [Calditerrivibrio nitroreducens]ADR18424.1 DegT/DnrJ/EryC1/StrS aminotransferase [Calditerrivibrio nitroreducens DSM 19672]
MIPMLDIKRELADIGDEIKKEIDKSLNATQFILGPNVKEFEESAAKYLGCKYAIGVASGTDALHLALKAIGIKDGDEVITTPFTFIATAEAIVYCGGKPVFVDVDEETMNIDVNKIESKITDRTKAIIPVHLFGNPCNMDKIKEIANKYNLKIVEDCAQSFGATYRGVKTGNIGDVGCFSFFPSKNLGCYGDGGMITTNDENIYKTALALRNHGSYVRYYHEMIGFNSRLDDIQAAILKIKLKYIDRFNNERRTVAKLYQETIGNCVGYQKETENGINVFHQYTITSDKRDKAIEALKQSEIASAIYYPVPLHLQNAFKYLGYVEGDFPVSEKLAKTVFSLPINPYLEESEVIIIGEIVKKALV